MNNVCLSGRIHEIRRSARCTYITLMITGQHDTQWLDVTLFEHQTRFFDKYFSKGKYINIIGHLRKTTYKDQIRLECVADSIGFCGAKTTDTTTIISDLPPEWQTSQPQPIQQTLTTEMM